MTTFLLSLALLLFLHLVASPVREEPPKKCTGQTPCPACSTCSRCRYCKVEGGTCGACQHPDNKEIIRQGYGRAYTKYPFDPGRMDEFRAADRSAREQKRGLWASVDPR